MPAFGALAAAGFTNAPPTVFVPSSGQGGIFLASGIRNFGGSGPALQIGFASFYDPNALLPSCGCVLHAGFDATWVNVGLAGGYLLVQYPPSMVGSSVHMQSVLVPVTSFAGPVSGFFYGPSFPFGCSEEPSLAPVLTDGCSFILP